MPCQNIFWSSVLRFTKWMKDSDRISDVPLQLSSHLTRLEHTADLSALATEARLLDYLPPLRTGRAGVEGERRVPECASVKRPLEKAPLSHEPRSGTWSLRCVSVQYFHCWNTSESLSRPPWWKWKILYWLSLLATTSCPQVHASSLGTKQRGQQPAFTAQHNEGPRNEGNWGATRERKWKANHKEV